MDTAALNLSPLRKLQRLSDINIIGIPGPILVQNIAALAELHELRKLSLAGVQVTDLSFAANLMKLEDITVNFVPLQDIRVIGQMKSLKSVTLVATAVVDIAPLLNLRMLKKVMLTNTPARSDVVTELERRGVAVQR
jgi:Leucine-rich repeat (LRR) protein